MAVALDTYIVTMLGQMATYLSWTTASTEIDIIIEDTLGLLGLASEAASTNTVSLRAVAMYVAWRAVKYTISTDYTYSADKAKYDRNAMQDAADRNFMSSKSEAFQYLSVGQLTIGEVTYTDDPYKESDIEEISTRRRI